MDIKIIPSKLRGSVSIPASKSIVHRALISAALADGVSVISKLHFLRISTPPLTLLKQ